MNTAKPLRPSVFNNALLPILEDSRAAAEVTKATVSSSRRALLGLLQGVNFGTIEDLVLREGEPVLGTVPRLILTIKIGGRDNCPRPEVDRNDFVLKAEIVELFEHFDRIWNGTVTIRVQHGLPTQISVENRR